MLKDSTIENDLLYVPKCIEVIKKIGNGGFSNVYKIKYNNTIYAMKIIKKSNNNKNLSIINNEHNILKELDNKYIIKLVKILGSRDNLLFIFDYYKGGNLNNIIKLYNYNKKIFPEDLLRFIMVKIFKGIKYLHDNNIIHRDLKPENILLNSIQKLKSVVICDFGLSIKQQDICFNFINEKCGTLCYMAPEILKGDYYDRSVDIWSCGIIMLSCLNNNLFTGLCREQIKHKIINNWQPNYDSINCSFLAKDLIKKMLIINPKERYNITQVLNHPWSLNNDSLTIPYTKSEALNVINNIIKLKLIFKKVLFLSNFITKKDKKINSNKIYKKNITIKNYNNILSNNTIKLNFIQPKKNSQKDKLLIDSSKYLLFKNNYIKRQYKINNKKLKNI